MPAPWLAPKARPCATAQAVRKPVNDPGPRPNAIASSWPSVNPHSACACFISAKMAGISVVDDFAPPGPVCCHTRMPSVTAIDITSVLVSNARNFMFLDVRSSCNPINTVTICYKNNSKIQPAPPAHGCSTTKQRRRAGKTHGGIISLSQLYLP